MTSKLNVNGKEVTHQREIRDKVTKLCNNPQNLDLCRIINIKFLILNTS
jgi:hypothetical protein